MSKIILSDEFETKLGTIKTWLESDSSNDSVFINKDSSLIANSHKIILQKFEVSNDWLKPHHNCESSRGWRWFIEKINDEDENLTLFCELIDSQSDFSKDYASGEWLDAIELENKTHHLYIGTEDGEIMRSRAINKDFMPQRLEKMLGNDSKNYSFTEYTDFGYKTNIPRLLKDEKIYFHFLVATNPIKIDPDNHSYRDLSPWFAVDWVKSTLDKYLA